MKRWTIFTAAALGVLLPALASAWPDNSLPPYRGPGSQTLPLDEIQRRAYEYDMEWRRRDEEERRRAGEERQRLQWRLEEERRREAFRERDERQKVWEQRAGSYGGQDFERFDEEELMQRRDAGRSGKKSGRGGAHREREHRGKPLDPKELRRYELIKPGERP